MMKSQSKRNPRRLVLRLEQVRVLDAGHLAQLRGGVTTDQISAGACTETCAEGRARTARGAARAEACSSGARGPETRSAH